MRLIAIVALAGAVLVAPVGAQTTPAPGAATDFNSKLINAPTAPWGIYGPGQTSKYDDKGGPQNYPATRVTVTVAGKNAWDAGAVTPLTKPIAKGDLIFVAVYLRAPMLKDGEATVLPFIGVTGATPPYDNVLMGDARISNQWKQYYAVGRAPRDFAAGAAQATVHLASEPHVIDVGPIRVFDLGPDADPSRLPHN